MATKDKLVNLEVLGLVNDRVNDLKSAITEKKNLFNPSGTGLPYVRNSSSSSNNYTLMNTYSVVGSVYTPVTTGKVYLTLVKFHIGSDDGSTVGSVRIYGAKKNSTDNTDPTTLLSRQNCDLSKAAKDSDQYIYRIYTVDTAMSVFYRIVADNSGTTSRTYDITFNNVITLEFDTQAEALQFAKEQAWNTTQTGWISAVDNVNRVKVDGTITDRINEIKNAERVQMDTLDYSPTLTKGSLVSQVTGAFAPNESYARTNVLNGIGTREAVSLQNDTYQLGISIYDSTGSSDGTGFLGYMDYDTGFKMLPYNAAKFAVSFRRKDLADLTDADVTAIGNALTFYKAKNKKPCTTGKNYFSVNVDRPLPFGTSELHDTTDEIESVLYLPSTYTMNGTPTRLILCCHGSTGYINKSNNVWYNENWMSLIGDLAAAGYACFDCNIFPNSVGTSLVGKNLGSPLYVQACKKAYDYIVDTYNVYPEIFVHGTSMGGVGATAFANTYPEIVLAESSFAGRDILQYIHEIVDTSENGWDATDKLTFANAYGYETFSDLEDDHFSHGIGYFPSLSLVKVNADGSLNLPPDRETSFADWMAYYGVLEAFGENDDAGTWIGHRKVPYKAWNSWDDRPTATKLETILAKAYNTAGNSCIYYNKIYDAVGTPGQDDAHTKMCHGQYVDPDNNEKVSAQLIEYYHQFE